MSIKGLLRQLWSAKVKSWPGRTMRITSGKYRESRLQDLVSGEATLLKAWVNDGYLVLDAGCGDGRNSFRLVDDLGIRPAKIAMLDINPDPLAAVQRSVQADFSTAHLFNLIRGSVFDVPSPAESFDAVIALGDVLSAAADGSIEDGLSELRRVTKSGGIILFSLVTKEYLLRFAMIHGGQEKVREVEETGTYSGWNEQYGEGVFKAWGDTSQVEHRVEGMGLRLLQQYQVHIDYADIIARLLLVCQKL